MRNQTCDQDFSEVTQKSADFKRSDSVDRVIDVLNIAVRLPVGLVATPFLLLVLWPNEIVLNPIVFGYVFVISAYLENARMLGLWQGHSDTRGSFHGKRAFFIVLETLVVGTAVAAMKSTTLAILFFPVWVGSAYLYLTLVPASQLLGELASSLRRRNPRIAGYGGARLPSCVPILCLLSTQAALARVSLRSPAGSERGL